MLYSYEECMKDHHSDYRIKQAVQNGMLYKLAPGIYLDRKYEPDTAIIRKKYPKAVFTLNSALAKSSLQGNVTIKGGVVMRSITENVRRAT